MSQPALPRKGTVLPTVFSLNVNVTRINTGEISNNNCYFSQALFTLSTCDIFFSGEMSRCQLLLLQKGEIISNIKIFQIKHQDTNNKVTRINWNFVLLVTKGKCILVFFFLKKCRLGKQHSGYARDFYA